MNATTHAIFGVAALAGAGVATGVEPSVYAYPAAVVASWVPDLDNPRSRLGNGLSRMKNPLLNALTRPLSWALRAISFTLMRTVGHRTLTHSLLGVALFALLLSPLRQFAELVPGLWLALVAGYASHLFADAINTRGVPLLWPVGRPFRVIPGGLRSGGALEVVVAAATAGLAAYLISQAHPDITGLI